jgi:hypothetical protein
MAIECRSNKAARPARLGKEFGMNKKPYGDILDSAAADSLSRNTNLWPVISAQLERKPLMMTLRTRPILALLIALFILLALSGVAYALGKSLGYIPGVGLVDQSAPIRVLAEPVTVKQQEISVTVSEVVADATRTFISYRVDGIPFVENERPACSSLPEMRLPDGSTLETTGGGEGIPVVRTGDSLNFEAEYIYTPIPTGENKVTFVLDCVLPKETGQGKWEIPLELVAAPAGFATPVAELPIVNTPAGIATPVAETPIVAGPAGFATPVAEMLIVTEGSQNKSGLTLERALETADSYILIGKFTDAGDLGGPLSISTASDSEYLPRIEDANGNPVAFTVREDARPDPDWDVAYYWAYEIAKPVATPLKITVDSVNLRQHNTAQFQLDTGEHPQAGQEWKLNLPVKLGASEFVVDSVTFLGDGYTFSLSSDNLPEGVTPYLEIVDSSLSPYQFDNEASTQAPDGDKVLYTITLTTGSTPPTGNLTVHWALDEFIPKEGPWSLVWTASTPSP